MGPLDGDIAAVIAGELVLFVIAGVLLIDDDDAEVGDGCEDGGAGSDDDACAVIAAAAGELPLLVPLRCSEAGVKHCDGVGCAVAEAVDEASGGLGRERDLRDEHQGPLAGIEDAFDETEVDLGLT